MLDVMVDQRVNLALICRRWFDEGYRKKNLLGAAQRIWGLPKAPGEHGRRFPRFLPPSGYRVGCNAEAETLRKVLCHSLVNWAAGPHAESRLSQEARLKSKGSKDT